MERKIIIRLHLIFAALMFPVAILFLVTGALYTWGIKGEYKSQIHSIELARSMEPNLLTLQEIVSNEMQSLGLDLPSGQAKIKKVGTSFQLEWTGSNRDVLLEPSITGKQARLTIKETSWYRYLVQLHKAKGGILFKVYAAFFALSLLLVLASGFGLAWQMPKYRQIALITASVGFLLFLLAVFLS